MGLNKNKIKKTIKYTLIGSFGTLLFTGCKEKVRNENSQVESKEIPIQIYNEIKVEGAVDLQYEAKPDEAAYLRVEAPENIFPLLDIYVKKNKLNIKSRESINPSRFVVYTNSPSLKYVESKGASNVTLKNAIAGDALKVDLRGVGNFNADNIVYAKAELNLYGVGNMHVGGQVAKAKILVKGNGNVDAFNLNVDELECNLQGNSNMNITANQKLSIDIRGNGKITYQGNPQITKQRIKGSGIVQPK